MTAAFAYHETRDSGAFETAATDFGRAVRTGLSPRVGADSSEAATDSNRTQLDAASHGTVRSRAAHAHVRAAQQQAVEVRNEVSVPDPCQIVRGITGNTGESVSG